MAVIKVHRPKLKFGEKIYFGALIKGFALTMTHAIKSILGKSQGADSLASSGLGVTMQFPEQRWDEHLPEHYRGAPALVTDEQGRERCVSCQIAHGCRRQRAIDLRQTDRQRARGEPWQGCDAACRSDEHQEKRGESADMKRAAPRAETPQDHRLNEGEPQAGTENERGNRKRHPPQARQEGKQQQQIRERTRQGDRQSGRLRPARSEDRGARASAATGDGDIRIEQRMDQEEQRDAETRCRAQSEGDANSFSRCRWRRFHGSSTRTR